MPPLLPRFRVAELKAEDTAKMEKIVLEASDVNDQPSVFTQATGSGPFVGLTEVCT